MSVHSFPDNTKASGVGQGGSAGPRILMFLRSLCLPTRHTVIPHYALRVEH